ncbi:MAG: glycosyltransferase family 4 protein [Lachnospiraceae bacterium]|nr:glycosyltransferase family 4 protein [Lachnospiraceae bacterium]
MKDKKKVYIVGSELTVKGGISSVMNNYVNYDGWEDYEIEHIATHDEPGILKKIKVYKKGYKKVKKICKKHSADIIHVHMSERGSFKRKASIVKLCKKYNMKVIIHHHGAEFLEYYKQGSKSLKNQIYRTLLAADLNIVLSNKLTDNIEYMCPDAKVKVLYNAVGTYDNNMYNPDGTGILFLGRLGERKGTYDLLNAIERLDSVIDKKYVFYLCGDGEIDKVNALIDKKKIRHRIAHVGWVSGEQKKEILKNTIINILPSYNEGLPMTILETMAYGIVNISTNIASIPEVIFSGENGILINPSDVDAIYNSLNELINNRDLRLSMSEKAYELVTEQFSLKRHIKMLETYYNDVINN